MTALEVTLIINELMSVSNFLLFAVKSFGIMGGEALLVVASALGGIGQIGQNWSAFFSNWKTKKY